ncbi:MAG: GNAT family N-acetyltransferase [Ruminiclostridium sp.]|nr:GNAT family N-acetyltransferase [Ruminiclostridium sp.]
MEIRFVGQNDDLREISNIYERSWKYAYRGIIPQEYLDSIPEGRWAKSITREGMNSLVVVEEGRFVGTASFCRSRWEKYSGFGEIVSIYFVPEFMGKGYGRLLLERCIEELGALGFTELLLWVLEENTRARRFYERNGFECSGEFLNDNIGGKEIREVMYRLSIELRKKS